MKNKKLDMSVASQHVLLIYLHQRHRRVRLRKIVGELSKAIADKVQERIEEVEPAEFMRKIGKKEYDVLLLFREAGIKSNSAKNEQSGWDKVLQFKASGVESCYLDIKGGRIG